MPAVLRKPNTVNAVRALAGLPAASFGSSSVILASQVSELRAALNAARSAIGLQPLAFTDAALTPFVTEIKAVHFLELRNGMR